jgi:hypothetical protein
MSAALVASIGLSAAETGVSDRCLLAHLASASIPGSSTGLGAGCVP